jgi:hypothetical protein
MQSDVLVGYRKVSTGLQTLRGGNTGELIVSAAHGNYYDPAVRGSIMEVCNATAGVAPGTVLSVAPPLSLWNPPGSGKNLAIFKCSMHYVSGTLGSGIVYHGFIPSQATVPTTGTELVPVCTLIGAPRGVGRAFTGSTYTAIPTPFRGMFTMGPALATTVAYQFICEAFMDDAIVVPPGSGYALQAVAGAGTSPLVNFSIAWEECDLIQ